MNAETTEMTHDLEMNFNKIEDETMVQAQVPTGASRRLLLNTCCAGRLTVKAYFEERGHSGVGHPVCYAEDPVSQPATTGGTGCHDSIAGSVVLTRGTGERQGRPQDVSGIPSSRQRYHYCGGGSSDSLYSPSRCAGAKGSEDKGSGDGSEDEDYQSGVCTPYPACRNDEGSQDGEAEVYSCAQSNGSPISGFVKANLDDQSH